MKPAPFDYVKARSVAHACEVLAESGGGATVIAGGQTLMPLLALRMSQPFVLVDITGIAELQGISVQDGLVRVGPATRQNDALADPVVAEHLPLMAQALRHVGHHQTRNRGTVGGSIALGEPAAEMPAVATALNATLHIASVRGQRSIPAREFYIGPYMTALEPDELLVAIDYPAWSQQSVVFREVARRPGDFALVGMAGALEIEGGLITRAGLAWMSMGPTPLPMEAVEEAIVGKPQGELALPQLADLALSIVEPFDDHHASAEYRRTVGRNVFIRAFANALDQRVAA